MKKCYKLFILSALFAMNTTASFSQDPFVVEYEQNPPPQSIIAILIGMFSPDDFDYNSDGKRDIIVRVGPNLVVRTFSQPDNLMLMASEVGISLDDYRSLGFHDVGGGPDKELILVPKLGAMGAVIACSLYPNNHFIPSFLWGVSQTGGWFFGVENTDGDAQAEILAVKPGEQFYVLGLGFTPGFKGDNPTEKVKGEKPSEKGMGLNFQLQYVAPPNFRWPSNFTYIEPGSQDLNYDNINEYGYFKLEGIDGESVVVSGADHEVLDNSTVPIELLSLNHTSMAYFDVTGEGFKHIMIGGSNTGSGLRDMEIILWLNPQTNEINTSLMPFLEQGFRVVAIGNSNGMGMMNTVIVMSNINTGRVIVVGDGPGFQGGSTNTLIVPQLPHADGALAYTLNMVYESEAPVQLFMPTKGLYDGTELDVNADGVVDLPNLVLQDSVGTDMAGFTVLDGASFEPIWETTVPTSGSLDPAPFFHGFFDANGDGQKEIIYGAETVQTSDSEIHKPFGTGFEIKFIYDIDGDGFEEIIGITPVGKVQVWSSSPGISSIIEESLEQVQKVEGSPNPSNGELRLRWHQPTTEAVWLNIFDTKGSLVMKLDFGQVASGEARRFVQISPTLPNGLYFGRVDSNGGQGVATFVLER